MYSCGGENGVGAIVATTDKTDMTAETTAAVASANLSTVRWSEGAVGNPSVAGYIGGGRTTTGTTDQTTTDKITFSTDTTSTPGSAVLSLARAQLVGLSERSSKGYFGGGISGSATWLTTCDIITFSGDSTAAGGSAVLSKARSVLGGLSEGTTKGYFAGGATASLGFVTTGDKITFSTDTTAAAATANLTTSRGRVMAGSDGSTKGYWAGGYTGAPQNTLDKITFSTDTTAFVGTLGGNAGASGSNGTALFCMGGSDGAGSLTAAGQKITFATDVVSAVGTGSGNLSSSRFILAGVATTGL
jgi:hypothetical protein